MVGEGIVVVKQWGLCVSFGIIQLPYLAAFRVVMAHGHARNLMAFRQDDPSWT